MDYQVYRDNLSLCVVPEFVCHFSSLAKAKRYIESVAPYGDNLDYDFWIYCFNDSHYRHCYKYRSNGEFKRFCDG